MKRRSVLLALAVLTPAFGDGVLGHTGETLAKTARKRAHPD
jgi:hypothetical protein